MPDLDGEALGPSRVTHLRGLLPLVDYSAVGLPEVRSLFRANPLVSPVTRLVQAPFLVTEDCTHADVYVRLVRR